MKITIVSKLYGRQTIDTDNFIASYASTSSTVFQVIEHIFNDWFDYNTQPGAPMGRDIEGMYYGEGDQPAIYSKKGAIRQGIESLIELLQETEKPSVIVTTKDIMKMDIEAAFE
jgi:hypothetical protein